MDWVIHFGVPPCMETPILDDMWRSLHNALAATGSEFTLDGRRTVIVLPNEEEVLETIAVGDPKGKTGWGRSYQERRGDEAYIYIYKNTHILQVYGCIYISFKSTTPNSGSWIAGTWHGSEQIVWCGWWWESGLLCHSGSGAHWLLSMDFYMQLRVVLD